MGFANPIEPVVSVTLSVGGKDFFYWPGYAGEDDAPVLSGPAVYARSQGGPCIALADGSVSIGKATWGAYGPIGPDASKTALRMEADLFYTAGELTFGLGTGPGAGGPCISFPNSGQIIANGFLQNLATPIPTGAWFHLELVTGKAVLVDGAPLLVGGQPLVLAGPAVDDAASLFARATGSGSAATRIRNVLATWEAP